MKNITLKDCNIPGGLNLERNHGGCRRVQYRCGSGDTRRKQSRLCGILENVIPQSVRGCYLLPAKGVKIHVLAVPILGNHPERISLFPDIAEVFIEHRTGYSLPATLFYVPSAPFSGILIYASGELPVHGENRSAPLEPALFPRIWDSDMNLLFESRMMDREDLLKTGPVAYADSLDAPAIAERVGRNPIRILARGVFGLAPTDPIIPREDALAIRNSPEGAELLRRGKIMIVISPE